MPETLQAVSVSLTPFLMCAKLPATSVVPISHTHNQLLSTPPPPPRCLHLVRCFLVYNYAELYITENMYQELKGGNLFSFQVEILR